MNWRQYQNELIVLLALCVMLGAFFYKSIKVSSGADNATSLQHSVNEFKEIVALKKVWGDKGISKKVTALEKLIPASKVTWSKRSKKLTASFKGLSSSELNKLSNKILSLAVQIQLLDIEKTGSLYNVEFKCKW